MKSTLYVLAICCIALSSCGPTYVTVQDQPQQPVQAVNEEVSYQTFYDDLSPYGQWIDYPNYGYVWMPTVDYGFKPYATNGHWVYSDAGWVWASDYNWGWATFHYGRWFYDIGYGWMWVPGNEWAPAWVSWRRSNDYYGWAPLGPGIGAEVSYSNYNPPNNYWCFVPHQYVTSPDVRNYYVNETRNVTIINNTTIINNNVTNNYYKSDNRGNNGGNNDRRNGYAVGPDPTEVSRETGATVRPVSIVNSNKPGQQLNNNNTQLSLFRPRVNQVSSTTNNNSQQRVAPTRFQRLSDVKPVNTNNNTNNEFNRINSSQPVNNQSTVPVTNNNRQSNFNERPTTTPVTTPANNQPFTRPSENTLPANNNNQNNNNFNNKNATTPASNNNNNPFNRPANNQPVNNQNQQVRTPQNNNNQFNKPLNTTIPANNTNQQTNNPFNHNKQLQQPQNKANQQQQPATNPTQTKFQRIPPNKNNNANNKDKEKKPDPQKQ
jgi:hypothetical protein